MKTNKQSPIRSNRANNSFREGLIIKSMDALGLPVLFLGLAGGILYFLFGDRSAPKDVVIGVILFFLLLARLLHAVNRHKLGLQILLVSLWVGFNLNILFFSPYLGLSSIALLLVMFATSLMLKRGWFTVSTGITILIHLLYYFALQMQVDFLAGRPPVELINVVMYLIFLIITGVIGIRFQRTLTRTLINAEKNLNLFRTVVDQFNSAVLILDTNLHIEELNIYAVRLLDTTYPKAMGQSLFKVIPPEIHEQATEIIESVLEKSTISGIQLKVQSNRDETLYLNVSAQILRTDSDAPAYIMVNIANMTHHKVNEQRIQRLAFLDHLTQIDNRLSFNYKLKSLVSEMNRDSGTFTLVYFDLNDFKRVNDERGHAVGDQVLQEFARRLRNMTREEDFIARIGGDEFVLLMENLPSEKHLARTLARLRVALNMPYQVEGGPYSLTVSFGVSKFPDDGDQAEVLLKQADQAMYRDKNEG